MKNKTDPDDKKCCDLSHSILRDEEIAKIRNLLEDGASICGTLYWTSK
jgi:hypothetical protein